MTALALSVVCVTCGDDTSEPLDANRQEFDPACLELDDASFAVESRILSGTVSIEGQLPTMVQLELRSTGDEGTVVIRSDDVGNYEVQIIPGIYDVYYELRYKSGQPRNRQGRVLEAVDLTQSRVLDISVPTVSVHGSLLLDGAPSSAAIYNDPTPRLWLSDKLGNPPFELVNNTEYATGGYDAMVLPGIYDVAVAVHQDFEPIAIHDSDWSPYLGYGAVLLHDVDMTADLQLDFDLTPAHIGGSFETSELERYVLLEGQDSRNFAVLTAFDGVLLGRAFPGTYSAYAENGQLLASAIEITDDATLELEHETVLLRGRYESFGPDPGHGTPSHINFDTWGSGLPLDADGRFEGELLTGVYDLTVGYGNTSHRDPGVRVVVDQPLDIVVSTHWTQIDFGFAVDGVAESDPRFELVSVDDPDRYSVVYDGQLRQTVVPAGEYRIRYRDCCTESSPQTNPMWLGSIELSDIDAVTPVHADVQVRTLEFNLRVDGQPPGDEGRRSFVFRRRGDDDTAISDAAYRLITGVYDVSWDWYHPWDADEVLPQNEGARLGCVNVR
jgi:hypothetical protein